MKYRIIDGYVVDASEAPETQFHPDIAADFIDRPAGAPEGLAVGWRLSEGVWTAPQPAPEPEAPPAAKAKLTYNQFVTLALTAGGMTPQGYSAARSNPDLMVYFDMLMQANGIEHDDPMMAMGAAAFVAAELITQQGWSAMLSAWPGA